MNNNTVVYSLQGAASLLNMPQVNVNALIKAGHIKTKKHGDKTLIPLESLSEYMANKLNFAT